MEDMMIMSSPENTMAVYGLPDKDDKITQTPNEVDEVKTEMNSTVFGPKPRMADRDVVVTNLLLAVVLYVLLMYVRGR